MANYGYAGRAVHLIPLSIAADWPAGKPIQVRADATWLVCEAHCIPEEGQFELVLETRAAVAEPADPDRARLFADARARLPRSGRIAATLARSEGQIRLGVPAAALPPEPASIAFFADEWGLLEHAAAQAWQIDGDRLLMTLVPGEAPAAAAPTGLLVVEHADGIDALPLDASGTLAGASGSIQDLPAGQSAGSDPDLLYLKGDWTNRDARITDYLAGFGRSGVPLYVYYAPGAEPQVLPQVLTESIVLDALQP